MIKSELVQRIASQNPHLYQRDVENIVNAILGEITSAMAKGDRVELRGFGAFSVKHRPARTGRNPRTGAHVSVDQKSVPFFKTGKEMRERLNRPGAILGSCFLRSSGMLWSWPGLSRPSVFEVEASQVFRKIVSTLIVVPLAVVIIAFAVANRQSVTVSFDPFSSTSPAYAATLPLFVLIFVVAYSRRADRRHRCLVRAEQMAAHRPQARSRRARPASGT